MVNIQILEYIKNQLLLGNSQEKIKGDLLSNGWTDLDVNEAIESLTSNTQSLPTAKSNHTTFLFVSLIVILLLVIAAVVGFKLYKTDSISQQEVALPENTRVDAITTDPWSVYDKMTSALKNADVSAFNSVSYTQITPEESLQFSALASFLYEETTKTAKDTYVNKWQDEKQAIYSTNPQKADDDKIYAYTQSSIAFVNLNGSWKVLLDSPLRGWSISKAGTNMTADQIEQNLQTMILDSDKDGLSDSEETCTGHKQFDKECIKTDPNQRDSNGNGWWDGIEAKMITSTPTPPKDELLGWNKYTNAQFGFSFMYPSNVFAYDAIDITGGQIPDIAGFGYSKPGQYSMDNPAPDEKIGSARILVWPSTSQDLKSWIRERDVRKLALTETTINDRTAFVIYSKATTAPEGQPMTFKTYYIQDGANIIEIMGFSATNQYSDAWIENFDKIVKTFKFAR